ncbi:MAG: amidohydrolase family protein [Solirubrobacteraceae bacterium]
MSADALLAPWYEQTMALLGPLALYDAHTHIGVNDPDTFKCTAEELLAALATTGSRAAVFPMHEPRGYPRANDHVIATAAASDGRLVAFCRVNPLEDAVAEVRRCVAAGARGIKLHPRAEQFALDGAGVREIAAEAHDGRLPILIHAGRGIPALGAHVLELATQFPRARFILAHAGVCDLAWMWRSVGQCPNVFFDTAWWSVPDLLALFTHVAPGQILYGTDIPFGAPMQGVVLVFRCALQAGLSAEQITSVAGGQLQRLVAGEDAVDVGSPPGPGLLRVDPMLQRVSHYLVSAIAAALAGGDTAEQTDLARLACLVGDDAPQAAICRSVLALLELHGTIEVGETLQERFTRLHVLVTAAVLAATPDVPVD